MDTGVRVPLLGKFAEPNDDHISEKLLTSGLSSTVVHRPTGELVTGIPNPRTSDATIMHPCYPRETVPTLVAVNSAKSRLINNITALPPFDEAVREISMFSGVTRSVVLWPHKRPTALMLESLQDTIYRNSKMMLNGERGIPKKTIRPLTDQDIIMHEGNWNTLMRRAYDNLAGSNLSQGYATIARSKTEGLWSLGLEWHTD